MNLNKETVRLATTYGCKKHIDKDRHYCVKYLDKLTLPSINTHKTNIIETLTPIMHSIKENISHKENVNQLNINDSNLIKKRSLLRGVFILCCFAWIASLGITLSLMGEQWWPITISIVLLLPVAVLGYIFFQIKQVNKQLEA